MAKFLSSFTDKLADTKSRTVIILVAAIIFIGIIIAFSSRKANDTLDGSISSAKVSALAVGGGGSAGVGNASDEYNQLQYKENEKRASEAEEAGGSSVPTLVSDQVVDSVSADEARRRELERLAREREEAYRRLMEQRKREEMLAAQRKAQAEALAAQAAANQAAESIMNSQAQALLARWAVVPDQKFQQGTEPPVAAGAARSGGAVASGSAQAGSGVLYKAGDIIFAVSITEVNSDEPGPVIARIVQGPLKGSKIIGSLNVVGKKMQLNFNLLNMKSANQSMPFNVTAVDPETARTALATDVNNHYLLRYGSLLGSAFLEGMSNAVLSSLGNTGIRDSSDNITVNAIRSTSREQVVAGLGNIGVKIAEQTDLSKTKPTIKIEAGTGFGLLFNQDFSLSSAESAGGQKIEATKTASSLENLDALQEKINEIVSKDTDDSGS